MEGKELFLPGLGISVYVTRARTLLDTATVISLVSTSPFCLLLKASLRVPYLPKCPQSHAISGSKQGWAWLILRWEVPIRGPQSPCLAVWLLALLIPLCFSVSPT